MSLEERFAAAAIDLVTMGQDRSCLEQTCEALRRTIESQEAKVRRLEEARSILKALAGCERCGGDGESDGLAARAREWLSEEDS